KNDDFVSFPYTLNQSFPVVTSSTVLTINYYDDYRWVGWYGITNTRDNSYDSYFAVASNTTYPYPQALIQVNQTRGLATGGWDNTGDVHASYFDDKARMLQTKSYNISGGWDITTNQYAFTGQVY